MKFRHCSLEISQQKNYFAHFGNKLSIKGRVGVRREPPDCSEGVGGNKALHPFQIWKASSTKSSLFNCPIYCTVEQVIIRAYLLIFELVSLTSLSLRCDFLGVQRDFSRLRLDFNYVFFSKFPRSSFAFLDI